MFKRLEKLFFALTFSIALTLVGCGASNALKQENNRLPAADNRAAAAAASTKETVAENNENSKNVARIDTAPDNAAEEKDDGILIDFRKQISFDAPKIAAARKRAIVAAVFGKNSGDVEINSAVEGSFTENAAKETAYLLQPGGARAVDPSSLEDTRLAIFSGGKPVAKFSAENCNFILRAADLNKNGKDELLLAGSNYQMGISTTWAKLVEIKDGRLNVVEDFKSVLLDGCGSQAASRDVKAALIKYNRQGTAQIDKKYFRAACPANADGKISPDAFRLTADKSIEQ